MDPAIQVGITRSNAPSIVRFLNAQLRSNAGFSIADEYPGLFGDFPGGQSLYVESDGEVVAHVAYLSRVFQHPLYQFKVGLIGSVVTAQAHRGHGFAGALLREALYQLKAQGCLFAVLWAEQPEFYRPLGFFPAGQEQLLRFSAQSILDDELSEPVFPFEPRLHAESVWRLYRQHDSTVDRSLQEFKRLCRIPKSKLFITTNKSGVTSYIVIQKGMDFTDTIHEWGGKAESIRANIARVQKHIMPGNPLTLIAPAQADLRKLKPMAERHWDGVLGMIRLLDRARLRAVYLDYLKASGYKLWMGEEWGGDGRSTPTKSDHEFLQAVLGGAKPPTQPVLPFFLWGLDSI